MPLPTYRVQHWADEMLLDVAWDVHETEDIREMDSTASQTGASLLDEWTSLQLDRPGLEDPMDVVRPKGGSFHIRTHLGPYMGRLRATEHNQWAQVLLERHSDERELHDQRAPGHPADVGVTIPDTRAAMLSTCSMSASTPVASRCAHRADYHEGQKI